MTQTPPPSDERRPRDADATRLALLRAAQRRFVLLGYERTTTRDVASDAGVNLALINRYYGGKQGLYEAVVQRFSELLSEVGPVAGGDFVEEFLSSLSPDAWPQLGAHPLVLLLRDAGSDEEIQRLRTEALRNITERISAGPARTGREDADRAVRLQLLLALFCGIVALREVAHLDPLATAEPDTLRPAIDDVVAALLGPTAT